MDDNDLSLNLVNTPKLKPNRKRKVDTNVDDKGCKKATAKKQAKLSDQKSETTLSKKSKFPLKERNEKFKSGKDFEFDHRRTPAASKASKAAKFSSLFKNIPQIPTVTNNNVKTSVKENLFSEDSFSMLNLHPHMIDCLQKRFKLTKMTQVQEKAIPIIMSGSDCFVKSQTGSGKTLSYAIPIIQKLQEKQPAIGRKDGIFALILVPTRELAIQICEVFETLCKSFIRIVAGALIGGMKKKAEKDRIRKGLNVLIATPGRLCDHLDTTMALDLAKVEYLVFDEADRMLDMDFEKKINFIIFKLNQRRKEVDGKRPQTLLISATLTSGIKEIARRMNVENPVDIDASTSNNYGDDAVVSNKNEDKEKIALPASLVHYYMTVPSKLRLISLISFILSRLFYSRERTASASNKMIVFASTNDSVQFHENVLTTFINHKFNLYFDDDDIPTQSKEKVHIYSLYGNMDQHNRSETLKKFIKSDSGVLICTDVAARGLDMPNVDWIIQYNAPESCYDYIHRVGRTARVGQSGKALIFLEPSEIEYIGELNKHAITLRELKLDSIIKCLMNEAEHYPRQINSDRLVVGKNPEEVANSMQFYIEEYVEKKSEAQALSRKAYLSFLRSYSCFSKELKEIFHLKKLHLGHVAKSFGLRQSPNEIVDNELNSNTKAQNGQRHRKELKMFTESKNTEEKGDRKPINKVNNKFKSPKSGFDKSGLGGLLRNYKQVDEYSSGFDSSQSFNVSKLKPKSVRKVPKTTNSKNHLVSNKVKRKISGKLSLSERMAKAPTANGDAKDKKKKKIVKRDMSVFDE